MHKYRRDGYVRQILQCHQILHKPLKPPVLCSSWQQFLCIRCYLRLSKGLRRQFWCSESLGLNHSYKQSTSSMPVNVFSTAATLLHRTMSSEFENVPDLPGIPPLELPSSSSSLSNNPNNFSFRLCRLRSECQKERAPLLSHCTPLMPLILFNSATVAAHSSGLRPPL